MVDRVGEVTGSAVFLLCGRWAVEDRQSQALDNAIRVASATFPAADVERAGVEVRVVARNCREFIYMC